jgi:phosphoenolpyruvate synthase/pyruvate phosphate dikinase
MKSFTLPLSDSQANLETVGGKGMSLEEMTSASSKPLQQETGHENPQPHP